VNYHLEHHLLMTVPHYHLPRLHALLRERGVLARACVEPAGYGAVLRRAAAKAA
jgi:fatty acid desaturase